MDARGDDEGHFDSDLDEIDQSSSVDRCEEGLKRVEMHVKEEGASIRKGLDELAGAIGLLRISVDEIRMSFRSSSSIGSGKVVNTLVSELYPLLTLTVDAKFPVDLLSAGVSAGMQSVWRRICSPDEINLPSTGGMDEISEEHGEEGIDDPVEKQIRNAQRFAKALLFGFQAKHTLKAYQEEDGSDHLRFRCRLIKALLSNAAQREERSTAASQAPGTSPESRSTPFWLKRHGISTRRVDDFYSRRFNAANTRRGGERSSVSGQKRGRGTEDPSEVEEVSTAVLKLLDGKLNNFLTKAREAVKMRLTESFWIFLLRESANSRVSLNEESNENIKEYAAIQEMENGPNVSADGDERNKGMYTALLESQELRFCVRYEVKVSGVPENGQRSTFFIRDRSGKLRLGSDSLPLAEVPRQFNALTIATKFCLAFTQSVSLEKFLARTPHSLRCIYGVALLFREILRQYKRSGFTIANPLKEAILASREAFGYLIAGDSVICRVEKQEDTITWQQFGELCGVQDKGDGANSDEDGHQGIGSQEGSEDEYLVT